MDTNKPSFFRSFASDNNSGICDEALQAIIECNHDHVVAYGDDPVTERVRLKFKHAFGPEAEAFFVFNGTAANVLSIKALCKPYEAVLCTNIAHLHTSECGAPESLAGAKLILIEPQNGKLKVEQLENELIGKGNPHHVQPKLISITQSTEVGTAYTPSEIKSISEFAKKHNLFLHVDGARLANAAAYLGCSLKEITTDVGVDVVSFGGTKNGLMGAEAVVFLRKDMGSDFKFHRKQMMQLSSKMRFVSAQFDAYLSNELWRRNAEQSNRLAKALAEKIQEIPSVEISYPVESNGIFAKMPKTVIKKLQEQVFFYVWNEGKSNKSEVRLMTAFDTSREDIDTLVNQVRIAAEM